MPAAQPSAFKGYFRTDTLYIDISRPWYCKCLSDGLICYANITRYLPYVATNFRSWVFPTFRQIRCHRTGIFTSAVAFHVSSDDLSWAREILISWFADPSLVTYYSCYRTVPRFKISIIRFTVTTTINAKNSITTYLWFPSP